MNKEEFVTKLNTAKQQFEANPKSEDALIGYAALLIQYYNTKLALDILVPALKANPKSGPVLWHIAAAHLYANQLDRALPPLYELLKHYPNHVEAREKVRFIHSRLVGSWHYEMMNDELRTTRLRSITGSKIDNFRLKVL